MLIYIDLLFILNCWIDYLLLLVTNLILKYNISHKKILLASLFGGLSTFLIAIKNTYLLFTLKILTAIIMELIVNGYKGLRSMLENAMYFYLSSIILAGGLYMLKLDKLTLKYNFILLIVVTPIILVISKKMIKKLDLFYKDRYDVTLYYKNKKYNYNAYLDTGNKLYDQYKKRPICLIYDKKIKFDYKEGILVPIQTANKESLLKCIKVESILLDDKVYNDVLIGLADVPFNMENINMILHKDILGGRKWYLFYY